jgi:hypothetical protein
LKIAFDESLDIGINDELMDSLMLPLKNSLFENVVRPLNLMTVTNLDIHFDELLMKWVVNGYFEIQ